MKIWFDGGCKPNPGKMEVAVVLSNGETFHERLSDGTNNEAEWIALLFAVDLASTRTKVVTLYGDSALIVNQANGVWKCKMPTLQPYLKEFLSKKKLFEKIDIVYIPREENPAGKHIESVN